MKIKILGTAAATSFPLVFCECDICKSARTNKGKDIRKRSSAIINDELLIDLSPDLCSSASLYNVDIAKIKYLLQTHSHSDHFDAGHFVTRWSEYGVKNVGHLDVYCSMGTAQGMNHGIKENEPAIDLFDEKWKRDMNYDLHIVKHGEEVEFGGYTIIPIDSKHDERTEALIYIISYENKTVLYGTDLLELSDEAWKILEKLKLDVVLLDQTYGEGVNNGGHLDAGQVVDIVGKMRKNHIVDENTKIYATHLSHEGNNVHEVMEQEAIQNGYHIAYDGLKIDI